MDTDFTPVASLLGGAMIGAAAVLLMAVAGRIMGATGILTGVLWPVSWAEARWRLAMIAGMVSAPLVYGLASGGMPEVTVPVGMPMLIAGGLIVGVGVSYGGGCTSGHGVCGIARLSPRSLVATGVFMAACVVTVFVVRHVLGLGGTT